MKQIHNFTIRVFIHDENEEEISLNTLLRFLPDDLEKEKIIIENEEIRVEHGTDFNKLEVKLTKDRHTKLAFNTLLNLLTTEEITTLIAQENRIDDNGRFFMRFERKALDHGKVILTDGGDCYHFSILIAAYPKNRTRAIEIVKEMLAQKTE